MDTEITLSIEARRNALYNYYDLPPDVRAKAEELFGRMEALVSECSDRADFETRFTASELNTEYNGLFSAFAAYVRKPDNVPTVEEHRRSVAASQAKSVVRGRTERGIKSILVRMMPDSLYKWHVYGIYNIPVLGNIVSAINTANVFQKIFRKKKKEEENEEMRK